MPLYRGNVIPFEFTVVATPNGCAGELWLRMEWDAKKNYVKISLKGKAALEPHPDVDRTEGVDYFPSPLIVEPEDVVDGRYQLWIVGGGTRNMRFYYDAQTLDFLGSELDFETPPPASIPLTIPTLALIGSPFFQPDANGDVDFEWTFAYDKAVRGDRDDLAHFIYTGVPPNLCEVNPARLDLSTLRPWASTPLPASEALPFSHYLESGISWDVTIEPAEYFTEPPVITQIGTYSGITNVAGTIPKGWRLDLDALFQNVAPPIRPWEGAGRCEDTYVGVHTKGINFCAPPPAQGGQP